MRMILAALAIWVMTAGMAVAQPSKVFNVSTYGAKPDDGTSDTTGIQKAIDAASAEAGAIGGRATVFFPTGVYHVTTITIDKPNITLDARDVRFEQLSGSGFNQMVYIKGVVDSGTAENIIVRGLTIDGNYPAINNSGSGIGFNIRANRTFFDGVSAEHTEDATFVTAYCMNNTFDHCESRYAGRSAFRIRGDNQQLLNSKAFEWNVVNDTNGNRAIVSDGQEVDTENILVQNFYGEAIEARAGMEGILIDSGDGDVDGSNTLSMGGSGQATSVHGKASWLIDAGHGFAVGDGIKIQETGVTEYDGASSTTGISHKIIEVDGNTFIRSVDANTFSLYTSSAYAIAGGSTGRYDITDSGTGTFQVKSAGALGKTFTVADTTADTFTCTTHGFTTGQMARLTVESESSGDSLPTGLKNVARVTVNTPYVSAGSNGKYWRPKRNKNVTFRDVTMLVTSPTGEDGVAMKVNNCHNLLIERMLVNSSHENTGFSINSFNLGPGNRKAVFKDCKFPKGINCLVTSWIPELEVLNCTLGDNANYPDYAIKSIQAARLTVKNCKLRFTGSGLITATTAANLRFDDIEMWDVQDNVFEGFSTSQTHQISIDTSAHMNISGKIRWFNNERRSAGAFVGLAVTTASSDTCTATNHGLLTGDTCYLTTSGSLAGPTASVMYFARRTGDNTFTLHTTAEGASNNTDRVDISGAGTGSHLLFGDHVACDLANSNPFDRMFMQRDGSGKNFLGVTAPSSTSVAFNVGDIIWNMNPSSLSDPSGSEPLGWVCTKRGVPSTSAGTFVELGADKQENLGFFTVTAPAYGALGDGSTDDTSAITAAIDAAETYTAANSSAKAIVYVPKGIYMVAGASGGGAVTVDGDRVTVAGPGTLKLVSGDDADAVLFVDGDYNTVEGITVDGNVAGTPSGRGEGVRVNGIHNVLRNVTAQNTDADGSGNTFLIQDGADYCTLESCTSIESGANGVRIGADYCTLHNFRAIGFLSKGLTVNADENLKSLVISGYYAESDTTDAGACGLQIDIGPDDGVSIEHVIINDASILLTGASGFGTGSKFVRIHNLEIDGLNVQTPNNAVSSIKLAEGLGSISIKNSILPYGINQDPSPYDPTGSVASVATSGGFARFTSTSHDVRVGDYVVLSNTTNYGGVHLVTAEDANTFTTNQKYAAETLTSVSFYNCARSLSLENVELGTRTATSADLLADIQVGELYVSKCKFLHYTTRAIDINDSGMPVSTISTIDVRDSYFESNSSIANYCLRTGSGTEWGSTSRKVVWQNNLFKAVGSNNGGLSPVTDVIVMLSASGSQRAEYTLNASTLPASSNTNVTWQVGDRFLKPAPTAGSSPGWVCTTAGTFATGTFTVIPELQSVPSFATTIVGNTGDVIGWSGTEWDDITMATAITSAFGNGTDNYVLTSDGAGGVAWEAASGGTGLTVTGSPVFGETVGYNDFDDTWVPAKPGAGVFDVTGYGASGRGETTTTGTATAASATLTLASASTFAKGQGIAVLGAGATHAVAAPAAPLIGTNGTDNDVTYTYSLYSLTGDGGWSTASSTGTSTDAVAGACGSTTLSSADCNFICWETVSGAEGYGICGRGASNRFTVNTLNGAPNARRITFGADPNFTIADIGTTVTQATTTHTGTLLAFSNTGRVAYVKPTLFGTHTFSGTANSTTAASGRGGTSNAAAGNAHYWQDSGDTSSLAHTIAAGAESGGATQPSHARRASTQYFPGQRFLHPMSDVGVQYIVTKVTPTASNYATTSATATGSVSYTSTVGVETADGDITVMPMPAFWPVAEPGSAKPNAHLTTIAAISGTTVTMADATGNAVTAQVVMHNDWKAISDARAAQTAANVKANELYFPAGNYNIITGDSEVDTWSQWDDSAAASNTLFGGSNQLARSWLFSDGASTYWMPLSHRAAHADTGDKDYFWRSLGFNQPRWVGGRFIYSPASEPSIIADDAWNRVIFFSDYSTGATQLAQSVEFRGAEFWSVSRFGDTSAENGYGRGHKMIGCIVKWGGGGHDSLCYSTFSEVCFNRFYGDIGFGSDVWYTDDEATDTINDRFLFHGNKIFRSRTNGVRLRINGCIVTGNHWTDSLGDVILCDSLFSGVIANNEAVNGGRFRLTGTRYSFADNTLLNVQISPAGGTDVAITGGVVTWDTNASSYFSSGLACLQIEGGTNVSVSGLTIRNIETASGPETALQISGGTRITLDGVSAYCESDPCPNVTSGFAGILNINGGQYRAGEGPQGANLCQHASAIVNVTGTLFQSAGNDDTLYSNNGTLTLSGVVSYCPVQFTSGVDGLRIDGCDIAKAGAGSTTISAPNASITDTTFGTNPSLSSSTGLSLSGNRITTSRSQTMTALAANTDNLLVGICDTLALTTNGTNSYNLTGLSGLAIGNTVKLVNAEASGTDQITLVHASTSSAGNQFFLVGAANYAMDPGDWIEVQPMTWLGSTYYVETARGP